MALRFEDLEDFLNFIDINVEIPVRIPKRYIRNRENPFEFFYEEAFQSRFRFTKEQIVFYLFPIIEENLRKLNNRGLPVPPLIQLLIALRFYASGSYQKVLGDLAIFSQSTVCNCIKRVSVAFARKLKEYIKFPTNIEDQENNIVSFYEISGFPNVAACIDGTLVKIARPARDIAEIFRCRKGFFALNILAAVGPSEFLFLDVRHPGSTHDQTSFDRSALKLYFEENFIRGLLLGDNGYACKSYLLTPVINRLNDLEARYNRSHIKTRNVVERAFGRWKATFSCLKRGLLNKLNNCIAIICGTAVLWNIRIHLNNPNDNYFEENLRENALQIDDPPRINNGLQYRRDFINRHFVED